MAYNVFTDLAHQTALVPTEKIVVEQQFLIFQPERADDILVHHVRDEELRQSFGIHDFLSRFLDILYDIRHGIAQLAFVVYRFEIRTSEPLVEICVLVRDLPPMRIEVVIFFLEQYARHRPVGDIEDTVKVQPLLFGASFPYSDVLPALSGTEIIQRAFQTFTESVFAVDLSVIRESCKVILWIL